MAIWWSVACPLCSNELYKNTHPGGLYSPDATGPKLFWRDDKCFMVCTSCYSLISLTGTREVRPTQLRKTEGTEPT
jgi:hypothetical protein